MVGVKLGGMRFGVKFAYESDLQDNLKEFIETTGIFCWRVPLGPVLIHIGKKQIMIPNPMKGFPDYAGVCARGEHRGKLYVIELKSAKGRLSKEQKTWIDKLEWAGALVCKAKSMNDINNFTKTYGIC